jgi:DNA-binding transcriptional LysR family regulator
MNLKNLEVFYWVVKLSGFSKAANKLNTTQSSVSQRIAALEEELGIEVMTRNSRSLNLTNKGRLLFEYAEKIVILQSDILIKLSSDQSFSGILRLGVSETIVNTWLTEFLVTARNKYPNLDIEFTVDITPELRNAVNDGELDMAFLMGPQQDSDLVEKELCRYDLVFLAAPSLGLGSELLSNAAIAANSLITFPKRTYPYNFLRQALMTPEHGVPRILTNSSLSTIVRLAEDGFGICVVPRVAVLKEVAQGRLELVRTNFILRDLTFAVAYAPGANDHIKAALSQLSRELAKKAFNDQSGTDAGTAAADP